MHFIGHCNMNLFGKVALWTAIDGKAHFFIKRYGRDICIKGTIGC